MRFSVVIAAAAVVTALAALAGCPPAEGTGPGEGEGEGEGDRDAGFPDAGSSFVVDDARAVAQIVDESGGVLFIDAADPEQIAYRLNVPPGALVEPTELRAAPLVSVELPAGELIAGVALEPEALALRAPALLTMTVPGNLAEAGAIFSFAHGAGGTEYGVASVDVSAQGTPVDAGPAPDGGPPSFTSRVFVDVAHFSAHGAATGDPAAAAAAASPGEGPAAQLTVDLLLAVTADGIDAATASALLQAFLDDEVRPRLVAAANDDALLDDALTTYATWLQLYERAAEIDPAVTVAFDGGELADLVHAAVRAAFVARNDRCNASASLDDAAAAADAWLWAPALRVADGDLAEEAIRDEFCVQLVVEETEFPSPLDEDTPVTVRVRAGLEIAGLAPPTHDEPITVRVASVSGGTIGDAQFVTDDQGDARTTATLTPDALGITLSLVVDYTPLWILEEPVVFFRPSRTAEEDGLLLAGSYTGTITDCYTCTGGAPPTCGPIGDELLVEGAPEKYLFTITRTGGGLQYFRGTGGANYGGGTETEGYDGPFAPIEPFVISVAWDGTNLSGSYGGVCHDGPIGMTRDPF